MTEETQTTAPIWRRELPDHVTVALDGTLPDVDPDLPGTRDRVVGRVVITMPAYTADSLSHLIAAMYHSAEVFGEPDWLGLNDRELADALFEAATASGYRCPEPGALVRARGA
jgi:hypothetical protein